MPQKRTVELTEEQASFIDRKIATGAFTGQNEVVQHIFEGAIERDAEFEEFMRKEVIEALREHDADPSTGMTLKQAFDDLRRQHADMKRDAAE